jgi:hypothetical protein
MARLALETSGRERNHLAIGSGLEVPNWYDSVNTYTEALVEAAKTMLKLTHRYVAGIST